MHNLAFIDIEATSADPEKANIIEIAFVVKSPDGKIVDHFHSLVRPEGRIPEEISALTGISQNMVDNAPEFHALAEKIHLKLRGTVLVAHKAEFDKNILKENFNRLGLSFDNKFQCTLEQAKRLVPGQKSYSLASLCAFFGIPLRKNHRAREDADATAGLHETLTLLSGEREPKEAFLPSHKRFIERTSPTPGIIALEDGQGSTLLKKAVDNMRGELARILELSPKNKVLVSSCRKIRAVETGSIARALLRLSRDNRPSWSLYSFKSNTGEIIVRVGRVKSNKQALFYFDTKKAALRSLEKIQNAAGKKRYAYREGGVDKSEITRKNSLIQEQINRMKPDLENTLIRSSRKVRGKYQYVVVKGHDRYAIFEHAGLLEKNGDFHWNSLRYKKLRPSERRALELSVQYSKNQINKTDISLKLRRLS